MRWLILITLLAGCLSKQGAPCSIDSDCKSGVCGLDGICRTSADPGTAFTDAGKTAPTPKDSSVDTPKPKDGPTGKMCSSADWAKDANTECPQPDTKYKITELALSTTIEHAFQGLADAGNPVIKTSVEKGEINISGWVWPAEKSTQECDFVIAWVMGADTVECTALNTTRFPLMMPQFASQDTGVIANIHDTVYDANAGTISGHIIVSELKAGLTEFTKSLADSLVPDVDTNDDGDNDAVSVVVHVTLTLQSE